jgi:hypothetical protein
MSEKPTENVEEENELDEENGELLPNREAMSIIDPNPGKLGPPVLDESFE